MGPEQDSNGKFVNVYENLFNLITYLVDMMKTEERFSKRKLKMAFNSPGRLSSC